MRTRERQGHRGVRRTITQKRLRGNNQAWRSAARSGHGGLLPMNTPGHDSSIDDRIRSLAATCPRRPAVIALDSRDREQVITWSQLERESAARAGLLPGRHAAAVAPVIAFDAPNDAESLIRIVACLRSSLPPLPLDPQMPQPERASLLDAASRQYPVHVWDERHPAAPTALAGEAAQADAKIPPGYLHATGGTSGLPRLIAGPGPVRYDPQRIPNSLFKATGWRSGQRQLVVGPLHHSASFTACIQGILDANTILLHEVFRPRSIVRILAEHAVEWVQLTPVHMQWMLMGMQNGNELLPSLRAIVHTAAPCPEAVKRAWLELLGPARIFEYYGMTENIGTTLVRGDEWLRHPGTVGRGFFTQIRILDALGRNSPPSSVGEIYMRRGGFAGEAWNSGAIRHTSDGFSSVGDYGWLDGEQYLFLSPRRDDMVLVGGTNVYPAEVEAVLMTHPEILDCAVLGVPDDLIGAQLTAFVALRPGSELDEPGVRSFCTGHLSQRKVPQSVHFVEKIPRSAAGKLHRRRLRDMAGFAPTGDACDG
jgi:bile acid-coenzyme A ligase